MNTTSDRQQLTQALRVVSIASTGTGQTVSLNRLAKNVARVLQRRLPEPIALDLQLAGGLPEIGADPRQTTELAVRLAKSVLEVCGDTRGTLSLSTSSVVSNRAGPKPRSNAHHGVVVRLHLCMTGGWGGPAAFREVLSRLGGAGLAYTEPGSEFPGEGAEPPRGVAVVVSVEDTPRGPTATLLVPAAPLGSPVATEPPTDQLSA
ncbi:MAG: hypothetical protein JRI68_00410 [Deltaproteobacteria bacterium]|nr:hypothetical protein [Deltaproteobacteria bacterium]